MYAPVAISTRLNKNGAFCFHKILYKMSVSSEDETDISDSELDEYVDRCYEQLLDGTQKLKLSDNVYQCPYCPGKKKVAYQLKDLLQHASDMGRGSQNKDIKHKGKHLGIARYLQNDVNQGNLSSEFTELTLEHSPENGLNELFVYPWIGILANVDANSFSGIKQDLTKRGFEPARVRTLFNTRYAVVEFKKDWSGFYRAVMFEKEFESKHQGKKDYLSATPSLNVLYGWIARGDDYNMEGVLGEFLQKNGDLKTVSQLEAGEKHRNSMLIGDLINTINKLRTHIEDLESNNHESPATADTHMAA